MPVQLLPNNFRPGASADQERKISVVMNTQKSSKPEQWIVQTLKRCKHKSPLNKYEQVRKALEDILSPKDAIWSLACLMLPKTTEDQMRQDDDPLMEAMNNYQLVHIEAHTMFIDMLHRHEMAFKLTDDTIDELKAYHRTIYVPDALSRNTEWAKEEDGKKLHDNFCKAIEEFVFHAPETALEGLEEGGVGELLGGKSEDVQKQIVAIIDKPLERPAPPVSKLPDLLRHPNIMPNPSSPISMWSQASQSPGLSASVVPAPVEPWQVVASNAPVTSAAHHSPIGHSPIGHSPISHSPLGYADMSMHEMSLPSPPPYNTPPYSTAGMFFSSPMVTAPIPALQLPSMFAPQCGAGIGYGAFGWERYADYTPTM